MTFRQAVIQLGGWKAKAGLWEQTFLPTHAIEPRSADGAPLYDTLSASDSIGADEDALEVFLHRILREELATAPPLADATVLVVLPPVWGRGVRETLLRMLLAPRTPQATAVAGVYLADAPVCAALAANAPGGTALVVDIGHCAVDVSAVVEGEIPPSAYECFAFCAETIVDDVVRAAALALSRVDPERRPTLCEAVIVTGGRTHDEALRAAVQDSLSSALVAISPFPAEHQVRSVRFVNVPEYYADVWREAASAAAWFGGGVTAKVVLGDLRQLVTRDEYKQRGRRVMSALPARD